MPTAAEIIADRLYAYGCRHAFTVPGGEVLAINDALSRAGITVHLARHENCAGFMAEGAHHFDGAPGILVGTIGPGIANAVNVIANATQDRVPLVALTGSVSAAERHTYTHQVFDHVAVLRPVTKGAFQVDAGSAAVVADKALALATEGRPGAVLLDLPIDVQTHDEPTPHPRRRRLSMSAPAEMPDLETARSWFTNAQRPILIAGVDVMSEGSGEVIAGFCEAHQIPLITTYKAKGILDEDHELALGGAGLSPKADTHLLPLLAQSDCIILAGYDPIEMRIGWRDPWPDTAKVIELSHAPNDHHMHQAALNFVGSVAAGLCAISRRGRRAAPWPDDAPAKARAALKAEWRTDETWGPAAVVDELRKALPADGVVTTDSGAHRILLSQAMPIHRPKGLLQSSGFCTMGAAVPLAIGRKLAEPSRTVIATLGDGGFEMFLGELATLRDMGLSLPILVFCDRQLALIELKQRRMQLPALAVGIGHTDYAAVAQALGGHGEWVRDRASLRTALTGAFERPGFSVIAAEIGEQAYDGRF